MTTQPVTALTFKSHKKVPSHRLPFVDKLPGKNGLCFWSVPAAGGYFGGNKTGAAVARIYMKHLKDHDTITSGGLLQSMVIDMFGGHAGTVAEQDALRGQVVGFFFELERWLVGAARHLDGGLDSHDPAALIEAANEGLKFDSTAYLASLSD